jgi:hypothetical protein
MKPAASRECSVLLLQAAGCISALQGVALGMGGCWVPPALLLVAPFAYLILSLDGPLVIP